MNREQMCGLLSDFVQLSTLVQHLVYKRANAFNQLRPRSFDSGIEFPKGSFSKNSKLIF